MIEDRKILVRLNKCIEKNRSVATVTVVKAEGSTPRGVGSTMLVDEEGNLIEGTIGGGILEEKAKRDAVDCIRHKKSTLIDYDLDRSSRNGNVLPMICGGKVSLFIKVYISQEELIVAGAGHIAEKLCKIAHILGYSITVLDSRKERLTKELFPNVGNLIHGDIVDNINNLDINKNTYIVIATHGHKFDQDVLEAVVRSNAKYIGMIGSLNKIKTCFNNLMEKGFTEEELSKVYTPIGLDLGGESPEEIALAIMAEIQAVKYGKDAPYLYKSR
ncbi:XdhC family protein [Tepidimicrobium xylanilyticum]|uniref:Xanthine dehydrogenase accessory factor n=1 Tax=Tepidimicrobium xylanilyticum TaxID=1123352 RepID=A0A1H2RHG3_9FIRM|nr:XdhC/CoxI family protein [Tepidimicrobium xylanilyticum]GMG95418.1 xanthine dehydrogenase accessory factor [Tepidimicrobium xylanilyticum]SDW18827.1 xanthine dehydrogenase accessory factor [Tepidimicrobium xylanilyticum]